MRSASSLQPNHRTVESVQLVDGRAIYTISSECQYQSSGHYQCIEINMQAMCDSHCRLMNDLIFPGTANELIAI
jgi:hypothetical protein